MTQMTLAALRRHAFQDLLKYFAEAALKGQVETNGPR